MKYVCNRYWWHVRAMPMAVDPNFLLLFATAHSLSLSLSLYWIVRYLFRIDTYESQMYCTKDVNNKNWWTAKRELLNAIMVYFITFVCAVCTRGILQLKMPWHLDQNIHYRRQMDDSNDCLIVLRTGHQKPIFITFCFVFGLTRFQMSTHVNINFYQFFLCVSFEHWEQQAISVRFL